MGNEFIAQLNQFGNFLQTDTARLEQEHKVDRVNDTITQAVQALESAKEIEDAAGIYRDIVGYAAQTDSLEALDVLNPIYQSKVGTLEYTKQKNANKLLGDQITRMTNMPIPEGVDALTYAKSLYAFAPEVASQILTDATGTKRHALVTTSRQMKDGSFVAHQTIEWGAQAGMSPEQEFAKWVRKQETQGDITLLRQQELAKYKAGLDMQVYGLKNSSGMTAADRLKLINQTRGFAKTLRMGLKSEAAIILNKMRGEEPFKKLYSEESILSKQLLKESPDLVLDDLLGNEDFAKALREYDESGEWQNSKAGVQGLPMLKNYIRASASANNAQEYLNTLFPSAPTAVPGNKVPTQEGETQHFIDPKKTEGSMSDLLEGF